MATDGGSVKEVVTSGSESARTQAGLLEVRDLRTVIASRRTSVKAVNGLTMQVRAGETVGLVGESGCGKSTVALSIIGLLPPGGQISGGSIKLYGRELTTLSDAELRRVRGSDVAMVFQDPMTSLNPTMTIGHQVGWPARVHLGLGRKQALERAVEVLGLVGMPRPRERLDVFPHQLSGGLRQRVVIAIALACEPRLLIADEPTTALDVTIQRQILELLTDLTRRLQMGLLLISHDMGVIAGRADRVLVMYAGQIVETAETAQLFEGMRHPYTEGLFDSIPGLETDPRQPLSSIPGAPPDLSRSIVGCRFAPRCRYVQDRCRHKDPPLASRDDHEHAYACFFPVSRVYGGSKPTAAAGRIATEHRRSDLAQSPDGPTDPLLVLDQVVKEFPIRKGVLQRQVRAVQAVTNVSLTIHRGETFGLVGESGCGKTTLGRLMVALERPTSGSIRFEGVEISKLRGAKLRQWRRDIQLMFQDPYASLDPRMRTFSILREPLSAQRIGTRNTQAETIARFLEDVGLSRDAGRRFPHEFSGGQRQRVGLARALILGPRLIIADEPVTALDVSIRAQILNLMKRLQAEHGLTYVIISHDLSVVRYLADRVGVMYLGKLVEVGPADEIYHRPAHPYTAGLLEAVPEADPAKERAKPRGSMSGELPSAGAPPSGCRFRTRCKFAQAICGEQEPPLRVFNIDAHQAACHFPLQRPLTESISR